jgi:hypothetical protein
LLQAAPQELLDLQYRRWLGHDHKVYSMSSAACSRSKARSVLAVAGEYGKVSFFPVPAESCPSERDGKSDTSLCTWAAEPALPHESTEGTCPLLSVKLHNRWVADVQFVNTTHTLNDFDYTDGLPLLSASDDGCLVLSKFLISPGAERSYSYSLTPVTNTLLLFLLLYDILVIYY